MFESGLKYTIEVSMTTVKCCNCGVVFGMPSDLQRRFRDDPDMWFYCPNGHKQHYGSSKSEEQIASLKKQLEQEQMAYEYQLRRNETLSKEVKEQSRIMKRIHNGVCPCCNRSFQNLKRHIESKHPEMISKKKTK